MELGMQEDVAYEALCGILSPHWTRVLMDRVFVEKSCGAPLHVVHLTHKRSGVIQWLQVFNSYVTRDEGYMMLSHHLKGFDGADGVLNTSRHLAGLLPRTGILVAGLGLELSPPLPTATGTSMAGPSGGLPIPGAPMPTPDRSPTPAPGPAAALSRLADCSTASECSRAFMRRAATLAKSIIKIGRGVVAKVT
ncbi:hypothetical protein EYF80_017995 [Liparis tanakae]|uniref:Uncharacterized protein n=1 Tax=Liparis tanakae TaxID=230148 RepID=A0A4Z2I3D2_9TELE|nr:hypothetical protein EYF80_017995 [Liparis tanakae]